MQATIHTARFETHCRHGHVQANYIEHVEARVATLEVELASAKGRVACTEARQADLEAKLGDLCRMNPS